MAYTKTTWVNDQTEVSAQNMNHIEDGVEKAYGQLLLEVTSIEPEEFQVGDKYYNTEDNKIYTAIDNEGTPEWETTGEEPELGVFYIVLESQNIYTYNGEKLVSVGGGAGGDSSPIGGVSMYAGDTAPDGFLMCDGQAVSRTTYKELFEVIGTTYGTGDGSTTFNVPNIKGKVVVMLDGSQTEFDTLGETGGEKTHTLTIDEMPSHNHKTVLNQEGNSQHTEYPLAFYHTTDLSYALYSRNGTANMYPSQSVGGGQAHNILQPYIVLNYIIKVQKIGGEVLSEELPVGTEIDFDGTSEDIPIGWEEVETYSTNEVKTGYNWIDGKPIYRQCFSGTTSSNANNLITINNINKLINQGGYVEYTGGYQFPISSSYGTDGTNDIRLIKNGNSNQINLQCGTNARNQHYEIYVEYTKTTD